MADVAKGVRQNMPSDAGGFDLSGFDGEDDTNYPQGNSDEPEASESVACLVTETGARIIADKLDGVYQDHYSIIYADPPWSYRDKARAGRRGASSKYQVQTLDYLASLPVSTIGKADSVLAMWATCPLLPDAIWLMQQWGYDYKTVGWVWVKTSGGKTGLHWGMGNWTRANAELCLLGVRGKPGRVSKSVHQIVQSPVGKHSAKPHRVANDLVDLLGDVPRIELFARDVKAGWHAWGNEI